MCLLPLGRKQKSEEVFSTAISWKGWDFSQTHQHSPLALEWGAASVSRAEGASIGADAAWWQAGRWHRWGFPATLILQVPLATRSPGHLWLPLGSLCTPWLHSCQSQLQSEVSLCGEAMGHMEGSWATWESTQAFVVQAIFDAFHHFLCLLTSR